MLAHPKGSTQENQAPTRVLGRYGEETLPKVPNSQRHTHSELAPEQQLGLLLLLTGAYRPQLTTSKPHSRTAYVAWMLRSGAA